jgi:hypothetical protein
MLHLFAGRQRPAGTGGLQSHNAAGRRSDTIAKRWHCGCVFNSLSSLRACRACANTHTDSQRPSPQLELRRRGFWLLNIKPPPCHLSLTMYFHGDFACGSSILAPLIDVCVRQVGKSTPTLSSGSRGQRRRPSSAGRVQPFRLRCGTAIDGDARLIWPAREWKRDTACRQFHLTRFLFPRRGSLWITVRSSASGI